MSVVTVTEVQRQIICVIKRFKFEDLQLTVMPIFPETSWTDIKTKLIQHRKSFTSPNVAQLIKIETLNLRYTDLKERLRTLQLIDLSWHNTRRIWYSYKLLNFNKSANYPTIRNIQNSMENYFKTLNMKIDVKITMHDDVMYISLTSKPIKSVPIYMALFVGDKYFFCTRKNVLSNVTQAIAHSMGYQKSKPFNLMGKNLKSLSAMLWRRNGRALNSENISETVQYMDADPDIKSTGIDFTQHKQRKKYAEQCFGDDTPTLESLVITAPDVPWVHKDLSTKLPSEKISVTWEFRSHNIVTFLKKLIEKKVLVSPVPNYISNFMVSGKNQFKLHRN
ncbi:uncharacterized protein LOC122405367 [Colletes gigas]|uniref:uncharacterized protein LOC122405367 n=1 Tax=Colletes gigas TaxID=935657 RepID=UPI001C9ADFB6|nr:uncharacterized protein LOC122405367 [Colletes gigas]